MKPAEIRQYRTQHRMTQESLAHKLMVDVTTVQRWEAGKTEPSLSAMQQLINLFLKRPPQNHPLLDALLGLNVPVAVLDEHAVYRRINRAFLEVLGFGDRAEVIGNYCLEVSPIWTKVTSGQTDPKPEKLLFSDFHTITVEGALMVEGQERPALHRITALKQQNFSSLLIHEIECEDYQLN